MEGLRITKPSRKQATDGFAGNRHDALRHHAHLRLSGVRELNRDHGYPSTPYWTMRTHPPVPFELTP
jgi:hypothetical protein